MRRARVVWDEALRIPTAQLPKKNYSECQIFCPIRHRLVIARAKPVAISFAAHEGDCFVVALLAMTASDLSPPKGH